MVADPAFVLDQVRHAPSRPQTGVIAQRCGPALESTLDALQVGPAQARFAPGASGFLQRPASTPFHLPRPTADRLPMDPDLSGHFRLRNSLPQQPGRNEAPLFQGLEIPLYSPWVSHAPSVAPEAGNVTILCNTQ
jgi:hypothetical protein